MDNTHKLLLAMCEALDLDVETIHSKTYGQLRELKYEETMFGGHRCELEFKGEGLYK